MRWTSHGRRPVYRSEWVEVWLDDVEIPHIGRVDHHVVIMPKPSTIAVVSNDNEELLLLWRHRFIPDAWGWEVPGGWGDAGETPDATIAREIEEETGWRPATVTRMTEYNALSGISTMHFTAFHATDVVKVGEPEKDESDRVEWLPVSDVVKLIESGLVLDGPSLTALTYYLAIHRNRI